MGLTIALIVILAVVVLVLFWGVGVYNSLIKLDNSTKEAFSTMDVYMKKRYDLIPNIVSTVKGYAKHESETLEKVIKARNMAVDSKSMEDKVKNENAFQQTLKSLFAVAEAYPELKANTNFLDLQNQLKVLEGEIAESRKYYNGVVKSYNNRIKVVPSNIVASIFKFKEKPMFETDEASRQNVKVEF